MNLMVFIFSLVISFIGFHDDWKLVKQTEDFKVFIRKPADAKFEQIKIIAFSNARLSEAVAVFEDVAKHTDWNYSTGESYMLDPRSYNDFDYYITLDMPFPVKDRDVVINYTRQQDPVTKAVKIVSRSKSGVKDPLDAFIRINDFYSSYDLSIEPKGGIRIEYYLDADPGGNLPAWVVNLITTKGPTQTMRSLLEILESRQYADRPAKNILD